MKGPPESTPYKGIPPPPPKPGELFKLTSKEEVQVEQKSLSESDKTKLKDYLEKKTELTLEQRKIIKIA